MTIAETAANLPVSIPTALVTIHRYDAEDDQPALWSLTEIKHQAEEGLTRQFLVETNIDPDKIESLLQPHWNKDILLGLFREERVLDKLHELGYNNKFPMSSVNEDLYRFIKHNMIPIEWQHDFDTDAEMRGRVFVYTRDHDTASLVLG